MDFSDGKSVSSVIERDIDLMLVQLLKTSPEFGEWFFGQIVQDDKVGQILGVKKSVYGGEGESDVAFGVKTRDGLRCLVLIEDKIDERQQERQAERYFERGQQHVNNTNWDTFHVCLIAPEQYITKAYHRAYGNVIRFEEIVEFVSGLDYDGKDFVLEVFEEALQKYEKGTSRGSMTEQSVLTAVADRISKLQTQLPETVPQEPSPKNFKLESAHPDHPDDTWYQVYVSGPYNDRKAVVRVDLKTRDSDTDFERVRRILSASVDELDGFEYHPNLDRGVVQKEVWREYSDLDEFIDRIVAALCELIWFYHPRLVE